MAEQQDDDDHLSDVPDGSGCAEIWEHLSERRAESDGTDDTDDDD